MKSDREHVITYSRCGICELAKQESCFALAKYIIEAIMETAEFAGSKRFYIVATMGSQSGRAEDYCKKTLQSRGMDFGGFRGVRMPDNYVISNVMMTGLAALERFGMQFRVFMNCTNHFQETETMPR